MPINNNNENLFKLLKSKGKEKILKTGIQARRKLSDIFNVLKENCQHRISHSIKNEGEIKTFQTNKLREFMTNSSAHKKS